MKKFKTLLLAGITAAMIVGCGESADDAVVGISIEKLEDVAPIVEATTEVTVEEEVNEDLPPRDGMVRSYFTNEWLDESINKNRPLAVM